MAVFNVDILICATAYVVADTAEEAARLAQQAFGQGGEASTRTGVTFGDVTTSGASFDELDGVTLSPAMTFYGSANGRPAGGRATFEPGDMDLAEGEPEDDGCPKGDPECTANNGDCHEACTTFAEREREATHSMCCSIHDGGRCNCHGDVDWSPEDDLPAVYLVEAEHWSTPGNPARVYQWPAKASEYALELVNSMLTELDLPPATDADEGLKIVKAKVEEEFGAADDVDVWITKMVLH